MSKFNISMVKWYLPKAYLPLLVIVQERVKTVQFCYGITLLNNNDILVCVLLDIIKG